MIHHLKLSPIYTISPNIYNISLDMYYTSVQCQMPRNNERYMTHILICAFR